MNFKSILFILIMCVAAKQLNAQIAPLYTNAPRCIFLYGNKKLGEEGLKYYNVDRRVAMFNNNIKMKGFSIDDNLKSNGKHKYISFQLYYPQEKNNDSISTINIYFRNMPDTISYYLDINGFKFGQTKDITIDSDKNSLQRLSKINTGDVFKRYAYDITDIVFPDYKSKQKIDH